VQHADGIATHTCRDVLAPSFHKAHPVCTIRPNCAPRTVLHYISDMLRTHGCRMQQQRPSALVTDQCTPPHTAQVTIAGGVGHVPVKRLAYDLCKAVALLPSDVSLLADGIKVRRAHCQADPSPTSSSGSSSSSNRVVARSCHVTGSCCHACACTQNDISSDVAEQQVLALRYLPHLPAEQLLQMLDKGAHRCCCVEQMHTTPAAVRGVAALAYHRSLQHGWLRRAVRLHHCRATAAPLRACCCCCR
jgi:hypothetical protein